MASMFLGFVHGHDRQNSNAGFQKFAVAVSIFGAIGSETGQSHCRECARRRTDLGGNAIGWLNFQLAYRDLCLARFVACGM